MNRIPLSQQHPVRGATIVTAGERSVTCGQTEKTPFHPSWVAHIVTKLLLVFTLAIAVLFSLPASAADIPEIDYTNPNSWAIYTPVSKADKKFDVFFIYPTIFADPDVDLMPWNEKTRNKVTHYSQVVLNYFRDNANIYCPYVRQLEFTRYMEYIRDPEKADKTVLERLAVGIEDAERALDYYLTNLNRGRPYIIIGHAQGALELGIAISDNTNVGPDFGFVAAYLPGISLKTSKEKEFRLPFAKRATDTGVILSWNTQSPTAGDNPFSGEGTYCINPLNWKTDETPAEKRENLGAILYDYKKNEFTKVAEFCGAKINAKKGVLVVDGLPEKEYSLNQYPGVYQYNDLLFFAKNIYENAAKRVDAFLGTSEKKQNK